MKLSNFLRFDPDYKGDGLRAKAARTRDVRRPDPMVVADMLNLVRQQTGPKAVRDYAILRLLYDWGLRVSSVVNLDLADVDLNEGIIYVTLKGHGVEKKRKTLETSFLPAIHANERAFVVPIVALLRAC